MILKIENLSKSFSGRTILDNVCITLSSGKVYALTGENGAGKSTFINCLSAITSIDSCELIEFNGKIVDIQSVEWKKSIGFLSDFVPLIDELTAHEFLNLHGAIYHLNKQYCNERIKDLFSLFFNGESIESYNNVLQSFSTGMRKKVRIISGLLHNPQIVLLDEPFSGLDTTSCEILSNKIKELANENKIVLFSSHNDTNIKVTADRLLELKSQKIFDSKNS